MTEAAAAVLVCGVEGTTLTQAEREFFQRVSPSGVTLFAWNVPEPQDRIADLIRSLQALRPSGSPPLVIAIDQEGGRVARLKAPPFPYHGPAMRLADGRDDGAALEVIHDLAQQVGTCLRELGFNVDFAPVVDILTEPSNTAIGDRAFGTDVEPVCRRAGAYLQGLHAAGVKACLKHFPGQGDARVDTHAGRALVDLPVKLLNDRELVPFRALLSQAEMVMISHCVYPQLAREEASRSPRIMGGLLRGEMGFKGLIVSDDMNMGAMPQDIQAWKDALVEAVAAGADMLLVCRYLDKFQLAHEALVKAAAKSRAFDTRLTDAAARVLRFRSGLASPAAT